jgi:hypothetical protein
MQQTQQRRTAPPPPSNAISADIQDWLNELEAEFGSCNTPDEMISVQESVMLPRQAQVSDAVWHQALEIVKKHLQRVEQGQ